MIKKYNISIIFPYIDGVSQLFLSQYVSILKSVSNNIFVVDKDRIYQCNHGWIINNNIENSGAAKHLFARFPNAIISELKTSFNTIRILPRTDILFLNSPVFGAILLPQLIAKIAAKKLVLITGGTQSKNTMVENKNKISLHIRILSKIIIAIEKMNYCLADTIVVFSEYEIHRKPGLVKHSEKVMCVGKRFVDNKIFRIEKDLCQRETKVGFIGRFAQEKGIDNFIEAIPLLLNNREDVNFLIIGDGPLLMDVKTSLKRMDLQAKVELLNWIYHDKLGGYLNELKLLVIPSYTEGLPNVMLEAMACGTPVLATPVGAIPDVIKDGETGFIMGDNSPECIGKNIMKTLEHPNLDEITKNARKLINREFTYEAAVKRYKKIFDSIYGQSKDKYLCRGIV
jgi:glycosyltransferase involved in cell wall biosynthesis